MKTVRSTLLVLLLTGCGDRVPDTPRKGAPALAPTATTPILRAPPEPVREPAPVATQRQPQPAIPAATTSKVTPERPVPAADIYRAIGTEPFWAVRLTGGQAVLERPDHRAVRYTVRRVADDATMILYRGDGFSLRISPGPCHDGMSDATWSDRVEIAFADGTLKGCGGTRAAMREDGR